MDRDATGPAVPVPAGPRSLLEPQRDPLPARVVKRVFGTLILLVAVLLPYRARLAYANAIGRVANALYTGFVRMVAWLLRQLKE
jgi:hypothetical protein